MRNITKSKLNAIKVTRNSSLNKRYVWFTEQNNLYFTTSIDANLDRTGRRHRMSGSTETQRWFGEFRHLVLSRIHLECLRPNEPTNVSLTVYIGLSLSLSLFLPHLMILFLLLLSLSLWKSLPFSPPFSLLSLLSLSPNICMRLNKYRYLNSGHVSELKSSALFSFLLRNLFYSFMINWSENWGLLLLCTLLEWLQVFLAFHAGLGWYIYVYPSMK